MDDQSASKLSRDSMSKLITVFGATGQQGGAVMRALLASGGFQLRGLTRNPDGDKSKALREKGVEMMKADLDDPSSVEAAVKGSYGVFLVTNYWEYMDKEREIRQGTTVADACKKANIQHVIYSSLEPVEELIGMPCPHFDAKAAVQKYMDELGLPNTGVCLSAYYQVFAMSAFYHKMDDGTYMYTSCMQGPMDGVSVEDCGPAIASIFNQPDRFIGKKVGLAGDRLTMEEYVAIVAETLGKQIRVNTISYDEFAKLPFPGADDTSVMFRFYKEGSFVRDRALTKELNPKTLRFCEWIECNKELFNF